jgi:hypothetical protein
VHQRHRLGILTITSRARQAEFGYLRKTLGLTPGNLSTHLAVLEGAGFVQVDKGLRGPASAHLGKHHPPGTLAVSPRRSNCTSRISPATNGYWGTDHPDILVLRRNLVDAYLAVGRY